MTLSGEFVAVVARLWKGGALRLAQTVLAAPGRALLASTGLRSVGQRRDDIDPAHRQKAFPLCHQAAR